MEPLLSLGFFSMVTGGQLSLVCPRNVQEARCGGVESQHQGDEAKCKVSLGEYRLETSLGAKRSCLKQLKIYTRLLYVSQIKL